VRAVASVQATTVDLLWIRNRVVCFGTARGERSYRAALAVEGPPEAFAAEPERSEPAVNAFAGFLNALGHAVQVLVVPRPASLDTYAARLEMRAAALPSPLASEALSDAHWARDEGPRLGLLERRAYLVVPAEDAAPTRIPRSLWVFRGLGRGREHETSVDELEARRRLDERCASLGDRLSRGGVWSERLDDFGLVRLVQACWSAWRHGEMDSRIARFGIDLDAYRARAETRSSA